MSKFYVIFKREYTQVVKKKSFLIGVFLTPFLMSIFMILPSWLARKEATTSEKVAVIDQSGMAIGQKFVEALDIYKLESNGEPYYLIENLIEIRPEDESEFTKIKDSLRQVIIDKDLKYFMVVRPEATLSDTNVYLVTNSDNFTSLSRFEGEISSILSAIRLEESNINLSIDSVLSITRRVDLRVQDAKGESIPFQVKYLGALIFVMLIFGMIIGYGQMVMRSVVEEKNSRIMEVMVSSVSPFQLMLGKVLGLGAATFTQVAIWVLMGVVLYTQKAVLSIDSSIDRILFNPVIPIFFVLFLVSGYILFSTLFALIGSIINNEKEAQSFVMPITLVMVLPIMIAIHVVQEPNSTLSTVLSLIPFFAPTMMMMRLVFVVPTLSEYTLTSGIIGEAIISFILVVLCTMIMLWITSKIFRIGILMYGKRPTLPEIVRWIRY